MVILEADRPLPPRLKIACYASQRYHGGTLQTGYFPGAENPQCLALQIGKSYNRLADVVRLRKKGS